MRTFSLLKGLPIYDKSVGEKIGEVYDICLSDNGKVEGFLVKNGAIFKKTAFLPLTKIASIGSDGMMIEEASILEPAEERTYRIFEGRERLLGRPLMSSEGERLGLLEDVYFHEELGTIVGYECSDGFFADMTEGKRVIKTEEPPLIGKDAIIVNIDS